MAVGQDLWSALVLLTEVACWAAGGLHLLWDSETIREAEELYLRTEHKTSVGASRIDVNIDFGKV